MGSTSVYYKFKFCLYQLLENVCGACSVLSVHFLQALAGEVLPWEQRYTEIATYGKIHMYTQILLSAL